MSKSRVRVSVSRALRGPRCNSAELIVYCRWRWIMTRTCCRTWMMCVRLLFFCAAGLDVTSPVYYSLTCSTPEDTPAYPPGTIDSTMHAITAGGIVAMVRVIRRNCWSGGTTIFLLTRRMADCIKNNNKAKNIFYNARVKPTGRCS